MNKLIRHIIINVIWPWIKEHVLPIIQEKVIEIALWVITQMGEKIKNWWNANNNDRQNEAERNEKAAAEKASNAETEAERDKYNAIADVWRTVANQYRVENEKLSEQLAKATQEAKEQVEQDIGKVDTNLTQSSGGMTLLIEGKTTKLPSIKE